MLPLETYGRALDHDELSRQQGVLSRLLQAEAIRSGTLTEALELLSRSLAHQASIDRVAIAVPDVVDNAALYAQTYTATDDSFAPPYTGSHPAPWLFARTLIARRPIIADDVAGNDLLKPDLVAVFAELDIRSVLMMPIEARGKTLGLINSSMVGRSVRWTGAQVALTAAIANLASLVIERHLRRLADEKRTLARQRLEQQQVALSRLLHNNTLNGRTLVDDLSALTETTSQTLGVDRASVWRFTPERDAAVALDCYDDRHASHDAGSKVLVADHPAYFDALLSSSATVIDDMHADLRVASFLPRYVASTGVASMLDMPIMNGSVPVGIFSAEKCGPPIVWTQEQKLFLAAVTGLAALAFERHERIRLEQQSLKAASRLTDHFTVVNALMESEQLKSGSYDEALRLLSSTLCHEIDADIVKLRVTPSAGVDTEAYSDVYHRALNQHRASNKSNRDAPLNHLDRLWFANTTVARDVTLDAKIMASYGPYIAHHDMRSLLQMPIRFQGNVVGYVRAWTSGRVAEWQSGESLLVASIAQLASLVLERHYRSRIEHSLRDANRNAEEASRAKSQFLANMSHEIRTPMNGVFGMTDLLLQTPLTTRQSQIVGTIQQSTSALLTIINDILDLSRIESGRVELDARPFHLRSCIDGAFAIFLEEARRKSIALSMQLDRACPEWLLGDAVRLRQICVNLLGNALKFTTSGSVTLSVESAATADAPSALRFIIRDTGIGIDADVQKSLFKPFAQADGSITRRFGGTGLGLSISKNLVEMMRGSIGLDSTPLCGTTVTMIIPLPAVAAPAVAESSTACLTAWLAGAAAGTQRKQSRFGGRVLIAEDNPVNQEVARELVASLGCTVHCADNGEDVLAVLSQQSFDLILMDCQMPVMDGLTATRQIRAGERESGSRRVPVVAVTANAFAEDRDACLEAGMDGYLSKPFNVRQLEDALIAWLPSHLVTTRQVAEPTKAPPASTPDVQPEIDPVVLEPMRRRRPEFYRRLLSTYLAHAPKLVDAIVAAAARADRDTIRQAAHSLKSSSANVGAGRLSALAREIETWSVTASGDSARAIDVAARIASSYAAVASHLQAEIGQIAAPPARSA